MSAQFLAVYCPPRPCLWCPHCGGMNIPRPSQRTSSSQKNLQRFHNYFPNLFRLLIGWSSWLKGWKKCRVRWNRLAFVYLSFPSLSLGKMKFRSDWVGANKVVNSGSVKARQWSKMAALSSANDSGMYQPNLERTQKLTSIFSRYISRCSFESKTKSLETKQISKL